MGSAEADSDHLGTYCEVLSNRLHLFTGVLVVLIILPVGFYCNQRLPEDLHRKTHNTIFTKQERLT